MKVLYNDDFIEKRVLMWKVETEAINLKNHREKFLPLQNKEETKEIKVSTTESELTFYRSRDKPVKPYIRPRIAADYFKKNECVYGRILCPYRQILSYRTTTREGFKQYVSGSEVCKTCSFLVNYTPSQYHTWKTLCPA